MNIETLEKNKTELQQEEIYKMIFETSGREEKRKVLRSLSKQAKQIIDLDPNCEEVTVNEVIINRMYKSANHREFNTFKGWKEKGFKVIKGSKAFFIWSKPRKAQRMSEEQSNEDEEKITQEYEFFGVANLFSNAQVQPIN